MKNEADIGDEGGRGGGEKANNDSISRNLSSRLHSLVCCSLARSYDVKTAREMEMKLSLFKNRVNNE